MKKLWKYIVGFFSFVGGILTLFLLSSNKNKKVKEIKKKINSSKKTVTKAKKQKNALKKSLNSKKKALKEIEKSKYKKKDVGVKEAADYLKKYSKKGK